MNPLSSGRNALRLAHDDGQLFADIENLGSVSVRAANHAIHLEKRARLGSSVSLQDDGLVFPQVGLALDRAACVQVHGALREEPKPTVRLEFDFLDQVNGLSFGASPVEPSGEGLARLIGTYAVEETCFEKLEEWRRRMQPAFKMCHCCAVNSLRRAHSPAEHPIHAIFESVRNLRQSLRVRFSGQSVDLTAQIAPTDLRVHGGWIRLVSPETILAVNLYFVHAVSLKAERLDGEELAVMRLHDSHGRQLVEISSAQSSLTRWQNVCEQHKEKGR